MSADQESPFDHLDALLGAAACELDTSLRAATDMTAMLAGLMAGDDAVSSARRDAVEDVAASVIAMRADVHEMRRDLLLLRMLDRRREDDRLLDRPPDALRDQVQELRDSMVRRAHELVRVLRGTAVPARTVDRGEDLLSALTLDHEVTLAVVSARTLTRTVSILDALGLAPGEYAEIFERFGVLDRIRALAATLDGVKGLNSPLNWAVDLTRAVRLVWRIATDVAGLLGGAGDVVGAAYLLPAWKQILSLVYSLERELARAYPYDLTEELIGDVVRDLIQDVAAIEVDASGLDLHHLDLHEVEVVAGVLWTADTVWPPGITDQVRERSREVAPGTFRVCGRGTEHQIEDHPAPAR
ncbi:hypothetical protein GCM10009677_15090 [Sphaerisporangium rubeum]|uniref:Uncharacterized protein n=1 Tax=Sphaerisporangium rubeum TaxID=321317 RepID=A0A7X0IBS5_9ACTN|nr:hypothetical protein [Sphaerisporangium rubeum]MBB6472180.1 hypothetical protein [Sphaerisporangium rubeum]